MHIKSKPVTPNSKLILDEFPFIRDKFDIHMLEIFEGASIAFVLKILGAGLAFGFNVLLARMFGAEGAGIYFLALTVTAIAVVFGRMGLDNTLLRFTASNAAIGDWEAVKGVYRKGMRLALVASAASAVVMFISAPPLADIVFRKPELTGQLRWMTLAVVPMVMLILHAEMLKALKRIRDSQLVQGVAVPALSLLGLYLLGQVWGVSGAVWVYTLAAIITAAVGYTMWRVATPQLQEIVGHFEASQLLRSSMPLFWVAFMNLLMSWTAIFMLGIWRTSADVGIFGVASRTAMLTSFILVAVNSIAAPKFAALYQQGDIEALGSTARNSTKLMILMASPVLLLFISAPGRVMGIFGPQFSEGATVLAILAVGQSVNVATGSVGYLLMMSGNERLMRNIVASIAVMSILLNIALVPLAGALGAAIATAVCLSFMNLIAAFLVWSRLGIWTIPFVWRSVNT